MMLLDAPESISTLSGTCPTLMLIMGSWGFTANANSSPVSTVYAFDGLCRGVVSLLGLVRHTGAKWSLPLHFVQVLPLAGHSGSLPKRPVLPH